MTDLRTLLHASAPTPTRAIDVDDLMRRSRRARLRRMGAWLAALGVTTGLAVPGGAVLVSAGRGERAAPPVTDPAVASDGHDARAATTSAIPTAAGTAPAAPVAPSSETARVTATTAHTLPGTPTPPGPLPAPPSTTMPPPAAEYPTASSCFVDNDGLGPGERRSCSFTATRPGGFHGHGGGPAGSAEADDYVEPERRVTVTRAGTTRVYVVRDVAVFAGDEGVSCDNDAVQPGDRVLVEIVNPPTGTAGVVRGVGAGEGWSCY